jgi:hypothetical protein
MQPNPPVLEIDGQLLDPAIVPQAKTIVARAAWAAAVRNRPSDDPPCGVTSG